MVLVEKKLELIRPAFHGGVVWLSVQTKDA